MSLVRSLLHRSLHWGCDDVRYGVRYDGETGLSWMSVRAYDPALGRFLSRDPLGRLPLFFSDQPYVYAGNNPLINVDPTGQRPADMSAADTRTMMAAAKKRMRTSWGKRHTWWHSCSNTGDLSRGCKRWRAWYSNASTLRYHAAGAALWTGRIVGLAGLVVLVFGTIWLMTHNSDLLKTFNYIDVVLGLAGDFISRATTGASDSWTSAVKVILTVIQGVLSVVNGLAAIIGKFGSFAIAAVRASLLLAGQAATPELAPFMAMVQAFAGSAVGYAMLAIGNGLVALGDASFALYYEINQSSVEDFCSYSGIIPGAACGSEPPSGYFAY